MFKFGSFPVKVMIMEQRGSSVVPFYDKARRVKEKTGMEYYLLKRKGEKLPAPDFKDVHIGNWLYLFSDSSGKFHPMEFEKSGFKITSDKTMNYMYATQLERNMIKFKFEKTLDKILPYAILFGTGIILAIVLHVGIGKITEMYQVVNPISADLKETMQIVQEILKNQCGVQQLPPPS